MQMASAMASAMASPGGSQFLEWSPDSVALGDESETRGIRKRRSHPKSRLGCTACRRRRVKCDEGRPRCGNCQRRDETCSLENLMPASRTKVLQPQEPRRGPSLGNRLCSHINMLQMKLLHHFNTVTAKTLVFDASIWRSQVMGLALQHEFLMHAVLLIAAKHLCFLDPDESIYRSASMLHLSETLRLFRHALTQPISASNADAFMATSTLLVHYAWASDDGVVQEQDDAWAVPPLASSLNLSMDPLLTLSQGLRMVFMHSYRFIRQNESIFAASARYRPRESLEQATFGHSKASQDLEILISKAYCKQRATSGSPVIACPKSACPDAVTRIFLDLRTGHEKALTGQEYPDEDSEEDLELVGFLDATARLVLILGLFQQQSFITETDPMRDADLAHSPEQTAAASVFEAVADHRFPPLSDLARYIFAFPTRSTDSFIRLVQRHHPYALLVLFFFYRAVFLLLPQQRCWWSRRRAQVVGSAIECALRAQGDVDVDTILQEGMRILEGEHAGIPNGENTTSVNQQRHLGVDCWDESWERTRCVLEKFGWRKGRWYSTEQAVSSQSI